MKKTLILSLSTLLIFNLTSCKEKANQDISIYLKGKEVVKIKDGKVKKVESTSYSYGEEGKLIKIYLPLGQKYEVKVNNLVSASLYRFDSLLDSYTLIEEFAKDIVISRYHIYIYY